MTVNQNTPAAPAAPDQTSSLTSSPTPSPTPSPPASPNPSRNTLAASLPIPIRVPKPPPKRGRGRPRSPVFQCFTRHLDSRGRFLKNECNFCSFNSVDASQNATYLKRHILQACGAAPQSVKLTLLPPAAAQHHYNTPTPHQQQTVVSPLPSFHTQPQHVHPHPQPPPTTTHAHTNTNTAAPADLRTETPALSSFSQHEQPPTLPNPALTSTKHTGEARPSHPHLRPNTLAITSTTTPPQQPLPPPHQPASSPSTPQHNQTGTLSATAPDTASTHASKPPMPPVPPKSTKTAHPRRGRRKSVAPLSFTRNVAPGGKFLANVCNYCSHITKSQNVTVMRNHLRSPVCRAPASVVAQLGGPASASKPS